MVQELPGQHGAERRHAGARPRDGAAGPGGRQHRLGLQAAWPRDPPEPLAQAHHGAREPPRVREPQHDRHAQDPQEVRKARRAHQAHGGLLHPRGPAPRRPQLGLCSGSRSFEWPSSHPVPSISLSILPPPFPTPCPCLPSLCLIPYPPLPCPSPFPSSPLHSPPQHPPSSSSLSHPHLLPLIIPLISLPSPSPKAELPEVSETPKLLLDMLCPKSSTFRPNAPFQSPLSQASPSLRFPCLSGHSPAIHDRNKLISCLPPLDPFSPRPQGTFLPDYVAQELDLMQNDPAVADIQERARVALGYINMIRKELVKAVPGASPGPGSCSPLHQPPTTPLHAAPFEPPPEKTTPLDLWGGLLGPVAADADDDDDA